MFFTHVTYLLKTLIKQLSITSTDLTPFITQLRFNDPFICALYTRNSAVQMLFPTIGLLLLYCLLIKWVFSETASQIGGKFYRELSAPTIYADFSSFQNLKSIFFFNF